MTGGCLPPRKRLLASLKQNGWHSDTLSGERPSSTQSNPATPAKESIIQPAPTSAPPKSSIFSRPGHECASCKTRQSTLWRKGRKGDIKLVFCNSCGVRFSKNKYCWHCCVVYPDGAAFSDESVWLACCRCSRYIHVECEEKTGRLVSERGEYLCPECLESPPPLNDSMRDPVNGFSNTNIALVSGKTSNSVSQPSIRILATAGSANMSPGRHENRSPPKKKPRSARDSRFKLVERPLSANKLETSKASYTLTRPPRPPLSVISGQSNLSISVDIESPLVKKVPETTLIFPPPPSPPVEAESSPSSPSEDIIAAAKAAAEVAAQVAREAREVARVKAGIAAKAALKARVALDAAAAAAMAQREVHSCRQTRSEAEQVSLISKAKAPGEEMAEAPDTRVTNGL